MLMRQRRGLQERSAPSPAEPGLRAGAGWGGSRCPGASHRPWTGRCLEVWPLLPSQVQAALSRREGAAAREEEEEAGASPQPSRRLPEPSSVNGGPAAGSRGDVNVREARRWCSVGVGVDVSFFILNDLSGRHWVVRSRRAQACGPLGASSARCVVCSPEPHARQRGCGPFALFSLRTPLPSGDPHTVVGSGTPRTGGL